MISLSLNTVYTDSAPVCPWLTSRPPRKLETKTKSGRNEEILIESLPKPTGGFQGQGDRTNQLIYLYLAASKWERTNHASYIVTEHPSTSLELRAGNAVTATGSELAAAVGIRSGHEAEHRTAAPSPNLLTPTPRHSAQHGVCFHGSLSFTAEYHQISPPNCRKGRSLMAVPIFLKNSSNFEKQAKAIFAPSLCCS